MKTGLKGGAALSALALGLACGSLGQGQISLLATGTLDETRAGLFADVSGLTYTLENGVRANELGGFGSAIAYAGGSEFLALPDRGPNAVPYNSAVDDTVSYINRFHTIHMDLKHRESGTGLPFVLTPKLQHTTLLWSFTPLVYGDAVGSGAPAKNNFFQHFFTGRSDNFDPAHNSGDPRDGRFDTEGIRMSNDGLSVFISDEYGPYIYEFSRLTGARLRSFELPPSLYVNTLSAMGAVEISDNLTGRVANKGMEGLAITPDGRTLVGIVQAALLQDANNGASKLLRIVTIDIRSGRTTHQYGYLLTKGSGVSEIVALNDHEFLVDERDGNGRASQNVAKVKQLYKIDLSNATDISDLVGSAAASYAVNKTLFLDIVSLLTQNNIDPTQIPAKIEGLAFGADVKDGAATYHTLWVANDNDFLETTTDPNGNTIANPNQFFVFGFTDADLGASVFVPQRIHKLFD